MSNSLRRRTFRHVASLTAAALAAATVSAETAQATTTNTPQPPALVRTAETLAHRTGFTDQTGAALRRTAPVRAVLLTPGLAVMLDVAPGAAFTDGRITINTPAADGTVTVAEPGGFGIVTTDHKAVQYRYTTAAAPGTTLVGATDGGLDQVDAAGHAVGHIDAAFAIDSAGTRLPASYSYNPASRQLVVTADTTHAVGAVFIDPSWHCWAIASAYGLGTLVIAAAWLFSDGSVSWVAWALRTWFRVSFNAADSIARACTR